ncbi:major facilitator superfamily MFS_1 [Pelosinus fermentans JBW45]|uniref:Major facilitator superfamily MFS_1 n=2 Tax=Pelosinus TaxID=365348 RepID=I9NSR4_9FIRM|nr:major facilitator superfamily MFS_1 [Pelosinus fermentans JBW45]
MRINQYKFNQLVWIIIMGIFLLRIGTSMSIPFMSIYLHFTLGISLSETGLIVGASYISHTFGGFFGGVLSDKYGKRYMLGLSLFLYALTFWGFGLSGTMPLEPSIISILFCIINIFAGLFRVWSETMAQAMLSDIVEESEKLAVFNIRYTAVNVGAAIGPIIGAMIGVSGTMLGFYIAGALCMSYFILFMIKSKTINSVKPSGINIRFSTTAKTLVDDKVLRFYIIGGIFAFLCYVQLESILGQILMQRFGHADVFTIILVVNAVTVIFLQIPLVNYYLKKYSPVYLMKVGCVFIAGGLMGTAFSGMYIPLYIINQIIFTIGEIFLFSIGGIFMDSIAPEELRGSYFGCMGFMYLGKSIGPIIGGALLQYLGSEQALCIFALISLGTICFYTQIEKHIVGSNNSNLILNKSI